MSEKEAAMATGSSAIPAAPVRDWPGLQLLARPVSAGRLRGRLAQLYPEIAARLSAIAVVGAAAEGQRLVRLAQERGIEVLALVDGDAAKHGIKVAGVAVE